MSCFGVGLSYVDGKVGVNVSGIFGVVGGGWLVWLRFLNFFVVLWVGCCMSYKHGLNNTLLVVMRGWDIERRCD